MENYYSILLLVGLDLWTSRLYYKYMYLLVDKFG